MTRLLLSQAYSTAGLALSAVDLLRASGIAAAVEFVPALNRFRLRMIGELE